MQTVESSSIARLEDGTLMQRLRLLVERDRRTSAQLLAHLGEVDARGLHRDAGYSSLFNYCVQALHMSEPQAALRIRVARLARDYPVVLPMLEVGQVHLSALRVLAPVLDDSNCDRFLRAATHKTRREVEQLVADAAPVPAVPDAVRKLPTRAAARPVTAQVDLLSREPAQADPPPDVPPPVVAPPRRVEMPSPLGQERFKIQFTADRALHDKLLQAQELMRHRVPSGDLSSIVGQALQLLVDKLQKERFAQTPRGRRSQRPAMPGSRHIPHEVRREVVERDQKRCTFVSEDGHRCDEMGRLEFHHEDPFACGGPATTDNIRLLCQAHNQLQAERDFGRGFMQGARRRGRRPVEETLPLWSQVPETHQA